MTTRQKNAIVLILAVLGTVGALYALEKNRSASEGAARPLDAIPADTFLLATAEVGPLRDSPLAEPLRALGSSMGKDLPGQCGFDPLERIDTLAVAIPEGEGIGDFGIATAGRLKKDELVNCARTIMQARGANLATRDVPNFTIVEDKRIFAVGQGKLAVRDLGPFLLAREPWLSNMMEAWEKKRPRVETNARHMELRRVLEARPSDAASEKGASDKPASATKPAIVVTALLPTKLRERLKQEMSGAVPNAAMLGVLAVEAAGMSLTITKAGMTELAAELRCETAPACAEVQNLITKKRNEWAGDFRMRLVGLGGVLSGLTVEAKGTQISARTRLPVDEARRLIERLLEFRGGSGDLKGRATDQKGGAPEKDAGAH